MERITITFDKGFMKIEGVDRVSSKHLKDACRELKALEQRRTENNHFRKMTKRRKGPCSLIKRFIRTLKKLFAAEKPRVQHVTVVRPLLLETRCTR